MPTEIININFKGNMLFQILDIKNLLSYKDISINKIDISTG